MQLRDLGALETITSFIDIEGDGSLELLGTPWLALDQVITRER